MNSKSNERMETVFPYQAISKSCPKLIEPAFNFHEIYSIDNNLDWEKPEEPIYTHLPHNHDLHKALSYRINTEGLCGEDLVNNPDILAIGCSLTVPMGIPHKLSWPHILAKELNMSVNVVAYPGSPVDRIVLNCFRTIEKYGKPKKIFFLIPNLTRLYIGEWSKDKENYTKKQFNWSWEYNNFFTQTKANQYKPLTYKDFSNTKRNIPIELIIQNVFANLDILELFCSVNDIDLKFFSWNLLADKALDLREYKSFAKPNDKRDWNYEDKHVYLVEDCHEPADEESEYFWSVGLDNPTPHPGVHQHIHIAERFLGRSIP
jgi:hypothetical protein